ncbi:PREDICTED: pumilio homolog 18-like isoform X2 [Brassica oleracea var. oleracea]|uniref:pumilio homolog 18-like isoform X2 n=1 Tax=Brassica oleracea var. oleracea TaxID=109376 RepID=UPI0006A7256E|nr:PREDICTED: pumilio homolog 18-like isoform X2 [Brassica oleracea var. oleracea]
MGMTHNNPFSMPTLFEALQRLHNARLIKLFNLMTSKECVSQFKEIISKEPDPEALPKIVSLLTSDSDYFMEVVRNKYGSKRVQKLLGISDDVDALFYAAILRRFYDIMTDKYASYVAIRAMLVFDTMEKFRMYDHVLYYALDIARDQYGCSALNEVITDVGDALYRKLILDLVACNALFLSNDPSGNFVVQHVLTLYDSRCTSNVAVSLLGHCVDLSFQKYGSYIVEKLLEAEESMAVVVVELLECEGGRLTRLARNEFGSFVVVKALRVTQEMDRIDMFWDLVQKLMPLRHLLVRSHGSNIAKILESCSI